MTTLDGSLVQRLHAFVDELRDRGIPASLTERIDAMRAVERADLSSPVGLHTALAATLVKSAEHLGVFDEIFHLYFHIADPSALASDSDATSEQAEAGDGADTEGRERLELDLDHAVRAVLDEGSEILARMVAEQAVAQYARFEPGAPVAGVLYELRTVQGLALEEVTKRMLAEAAAGNGPGGADGGGIAVGAVTGPSAAEKAIKRNAETLRREIREVIRELLVADRGLEAVARTLRTPLPADVVISMASPAQLAEIDRIMAPLQRKLATTLMRKRRAHQGPLDLRATVRASMSTGGVPVRISYRKPTPSKPQLFVLADVSGSVATFAAFTVTLVSAMSQLFSRLRTFAFVENALEVTQLFDETRDPLRALNALNHLEGLAFGTGRTDYGRSLRQFWSEAGPQLGRRSTVLVFGDARGNYRPAEEQTLARVSRSAGRVYWLNPEPQRDWGTGDSLMDVYHKHCTDVVSCRTLNDLRKFAERLD